jgi:hypothetical protein
VSTSLKTKHLKQLQKQGEIRGTSHRAHPGAWRKEILSEMKEIREAIFSDLASVFDTGLVLCMAATDPCPLGLRVSKNCNHVLVKPKSDVKKLPYSQSCLSHLILRGEKKLVK